MNPRTLALNAYYYGTLPLRSWHRRRLCEAGNAPLCVLFYHRVADTHPNDWSISNDEFERQMRWLRNNVELVSLSEIQRRIASGRNDRVAVAITFDDGYAENCERALPFLIENQIPMTYFVTLDHIVNDRPFPHDVDAGVPLPVNSPQQIREMADAGIEIGAHGRTHRDFGRIDDPDVLEDELVTAASELADLAGTEIRQFAFPYGQPQNMTVEAALIARKHGFSGISSAYGAYNFPGDDPFHLRRVHSGPGMIRLVNWMTVDIRKTKPDRRFDVPLSAEDGSVDLAALGVSVLPGVAPQGIVTGPTQMQ